MTYDWLVGIDPSGAELDPDTGIAESWEHNDDSTEWTFHLRDDAIFHNGAPVTASDVVFSLERALDEESAQPYATQIRDRVESIEQVDESTIRIVTSEPFLFLDYMLSALAGTEGIVLPAAYLEEVGDAGFVEEPIGSGPYQLDSFLAGSEIALSATTEPHFAASTEGTPVFAELLIREVPEESTRVAGLQTGELDLIGVSADGLQQIEGDETFRVYERADGAAALIWLHQIYEEASVLNDVRVREALNLAIDRDEVLDTLMGGRGAVSSNITPTWSVGFVEGREPIPFDPQRARRLLDEAGLGDGFTLHFYLFPRPELPEGEDIAQAIAGYWSEIGVETEFTPIEYADWLATWREDGFTNPAAGGVLALSNRAFFDTSLGLFFGAPDNPLLLYTDDELAGYVDAAQNAATIEDYEAAIANADDYILSNWLFVPLLRVSEYYAGQSDLPDWDLGQHEQGFNIRNLILG